MKLTNHELAFLSTWAREEWEPACYQMHAHRLQLANRASGALLIDFIKAWTAKEAKKDQDILVAASAVEPPWPWSNEDEFRSRWEEVGSPRNQSATMAKSMIN